MQLTNRRLLFIINNGCRKIRIKKKKKKPESLMKQALFFRRVNNYTN